MKTWIRRFASRPASVSLEAMGSDSPRPSTIRRLASAPRSVSQSATDWARATDSAGRAQPMVLPGWNPKGYLNNACHRIAVQVT